MSFDDFKVLVKGMKSIWASERFLPDGDSIKVWYQLLKDLPYDLANAAIQRYAITNKFPPSIAEIREQAALLMDGDLINDWATGWNQVMRAIGAYGQWSEEKALESMDEITRACVKRLGWKELCMSENPVADRANFRMIYEQIQQQKKETAALPAGLKQNIAEITSNLKMIGGTDE